MEVPFHFIIQQNHFFLQNRGKKLPEKYDFIV